MSVEGGASVVGVALSGVAVAVAGLAIVSATGACLGVYYGGKGALKCGRWLLQAIQEAQTELEQRQKEKAQRREEEKKREALALVERQRGRTEKKRRQAAERQALEAFLRQEEEFWQELARQREEDGAEAALSEAESAVEWLYSEEEEGLRALRHTMEIQDEEGIERVKFLLGEARQDMEAGRPGESSRKARMARERLEQLKASALETLNRSLYSHIASNVKEALQEMGYAGIEEHAQAGRRSFEAQKGDKRFKVNLNDEGVIEYDLDGFGCDREGKAGCVPEMERFFQELDRRGISVDSRTPRLKGEAGRHLSLQELVVERISSALSRMGCRQVTIRQAGEHRVIEAEIGQARIDEAGEVLLSPELARLLDEGSKAEDPQGSRGQEKRREPA